MKKILSLLCFVLFFANLNALIIHTPNLETFEKAIAEADQNSLIMLDVDDTIIVAKDMILQSRAMQTWKDLLVETIKNPLIVDTSKYNHEYFVSKVFLKMECDLVDSRLISLLKDLQNKNLKTIAFTKLRSGRFGIIEELADWRASQLKQKEIDFRSPFFQHPEVVIQHGDVEGYFKNGILHANKGTKGPVLVEFLNHINWKPTKIYFLDDRMDYLESVEEALKDSGIEFFGFHYTDLEERPFHLDVDLARFQLMYLAKNGIWLNDAEALEEMGALAY